jgi:choline dehydrogenase-like flavoprotein
MSASATVQVSCDIVVVGSGPAGCSAAATAGHAGVSVILVEKRRRPGGTYPAAELGAVCGLYPGQDGRLREPDESRCFSRRFLGRLRQAMPGYSPVRVGKVHVAQCHSSLFCSIMEAELLASPTVDFRTGSEVTGVCLEGGAVTGVEWRSGGKTTRASAHAVLDCSGSGEVFTRCPGASAVPERRQLSAMAFVLTGNLDYSDLVSFQAAATIDALWRAGACPGWWRFMRLRGESGGRRIFGQFNFPTGAYGCAEEVSQDIARLHTHLLERVRGLEGSVLAGTGGVCSRDGPVLRGDHTLDLPDVTMAGRHPDAVAFGHWPVEFWADESGQVMTWGPVSGGYGIPDGCLKSSHYQGLYAAGKCISATADGLAAARVVGTCFDTGERAAMLAVEFVARRKRGR